MIVHLQRNGKSVHGIAIDKVKFMLISVKNKNKVKIKNKNNNDNNLNVSFKYSCIINECMTWLKYK